MKHQKIISEIENNHKPKVKFFDTGYEQGQKAGKRTKAQMELSQNFSISLYKDRCKDSFEYRNKPINENFIPYFEAGFQKAIMDLIK